MNIKWGCLLAAAVWAQDCLVDLDGSYVSTQVDVLSPKHDERYTEGEAIPLGLEVQAWPCLLYTSPSPRD